jgi:Arc/MetJ-type ribon-helix-helix transcriptional regulator
MGSQSGFDTRRHDGNFGEMNIVLPPDLEKYVESLVQNGRYPASSEVIAEAGIREAAG